MNRNPLTKYLILSGIFLILSLLAFFMLYTQIRNNKQIAEETETQWQNESTVQAKIKTLDISIKGISTERALLESHFAKTSDIVPLLDIVENMALQVGAQASIESVDALTEGVGLSIGIKSRGSFESIYKLIRLLENAPYEIEINSFDMKRVGGIQEGDIKSEWIANFDVTLLSFIK